jgi:hypothetical protein
MKFRLKALSLHLLASGIALTLILGGLYAGWYRWPGWYLANVTQVVAVLTGVDLVIGPLLTFVIADPGKARRSLVRDVAVIAAIQVIALAYGTLLLWHGRPLYYAFSEDVLQLVQAYDIDADQLARARREHAELIPHWYSLPRWIWAPLPSDPVARDRIIGSAVSGGADVISMPQYYKPWESGLPSLMTQLKKLDDQKYFSGVEKQVLKGRMQSAGLAADQANTLAFTGRGRPLLAVFDPENAKILAILTVK